MLDIPDVAIKDYLTDRKTAACAYFYDLAALRRHVQAMVSALPEKCSLTYAVKANSDEHILRALAPLVSGFDTASAGEIEKVRTLSNDAFLAFGGPAKTVEEFYSGIKNGVNLFHIESTQQLRCLNQVSESLDTQVDILLRVNPSISLPSATLKMGGISTQFGIEQPQIPEAIELAKQLAAVNLVGFHFHAISNNLDKNTHLELIEEYIHLLKAWKKQHSLDIRYLNVGGGIGVNYSDLSAQFDWRLFCKELDLLLIKHEDVITANVKVIFECGRYITAFCGFYLAEVVDIKSNHGEHFALLRGGSHHFRLPVSWQHNHPFQVIPTKRWNFDFPPVAIEAKQVTLCGELCTPKDVLAREVFIESLKQGDAILFVMAGAYGWHISHHDFLSHPYPDFIYLDSE